MDESEGSGLSEGPISPSELEIIGVNRNRPASNNLVEIPQVAITRMETDDRLEADIDNPEPEETDDIPPGTFADLGYGFRISAQNPVPLSTISGAGLRGESSSGAFPSNKEPVNPPSDEELGGSGSPFSFDSNLIEKNPEFQQWKQGGSRLMPLDSSDDEYVEREESVNEEAAGVNEEDESESSSGGEGDDLATSINNLSRALVLINEERASSKKKMIGAEIKAERKPIGPLNPEAEQNDDGRIPTCATKYTEKDIPRLRRVCEIPDEYEILIPRPDQTLYNPPKGYLTFHTQAFKCGWRLPMIPAIEEFFRFTSLCPTQVLPNALGTIICVGVVMALKGEDFHYRKMLLAFTLASSPGIPFFFFNARRGYKFLDRYETSHSTKWWPKYIYVKHSSGDWNLPTFFRRDSFTTLKMKKGTGVAGVPKTDRMVV